MEYESGYECCLGEKEPTVIYIQDFRRKQLRLYTSPYISESKIRHKLSAQEIQGKELGKYNLEITCPVCGELIDVKNIPREYEWFVEPHMIQTISISEIPKNCMVASFKIGGENKHE